MHKEEREEHDPARRCERCDTETRHAELIAALERIGRSIDDAATIIARSRR